MSISRFLFLRHGSTKWLGEDDASLPHCRDGHQVLPVPAEQSDSKCGGGTDAKVGAPSQLMRSPAPMPHRRRNRCEGAQRRTSTAGQALFRRTSISITLIHVCWMKGRYYPRRQRSSCTGGFNVRRRPKRTFLCIRAWTSNRRCCA